MKTVDDILKAGAKPAPSRTATAILGGNERVEAILANAKLGNRNAAGPHKKQAAFEIKDPERMAFHAEEAKRFDSVHLPLLAEAHRLSEYAYRVGTPEAHKFALYGHQEAFRTANAFGRWNGHWGPKEAFQRHIEEHRQHAGAGFKNTASDRSEAFDSIRASAGKPPITSQDIHQGSVAKADYEGSLNPSSIVARGGESIWVKAQEAASKSYPVDSDAYWPSVVSIYKSMGGKVKAADASTPDVVKSKQGSDIIFCRASTSLNTASESAWKQGERVEFMYMPSGTHTICAGFRDKSILLTVEVDPQRDTGVVQASFDKLSARYPKQKPFGCIEHEEKDASVWAHGFTAKDDGIYLAAEPSALGEQHVNGRIHRSWSPSFMTDADYSKAKVANGIYEFPAGVRGSEQNPARITGVAFCVGTLTNNPAFKEMNPVRAREAAAAAASRAQPESKSTETIHAMSNSQTKLKETTSHAKLATKAADAASALAAHTHAGPHDQHLAARLHEHAANVHEQAHRLHKAEGNEDEAEEHKDCHLEHMRQAGEHQGIHSHMCRIVASEGGEDDAVRATWSDAAKVPKSQKVSGAHALEAENFGVSHISRLAHEASSRAYRTGDKQEHREAQLLHQHAAATAAKMSAKGLAEAHEEHSAQHGKHVGGTIRSSEGSQANSILAKATAGKSPVDKILSRSAHAGSVN